MAWTDEQVELLKKLWNEGLSASQIARQMGGLTRNAVIGKVHRLGLSGRAMPARVSTASTSAEQRMQPSTPRLPSDARFAGDRLAAGGEKLSEQLLSTEERASVLHLTEHTCKWPIGDPGTHDFHFCGARAKLGSPYCEKHIEMAYQPMERRRKKKRA